MARIVGGVQSIVAFPNFTTFTAKVVSVPTAGTPVQLPSIDIPNGASLFIRAKPTNGKGNVFLADSSADTAIVTSRLVLGSGEGIELNVQNANAVWIDGSINGMQVELIVEQ